MSDTENKPFGEYEEQAIVALMLDNPEFFSGIAKYLDKDLFHKAEVQFVVLHILQYYEKYDVFPTRLLLRDIITKKLTVDDAYVNDILGVLDSKVNHRDVPIIKDSLLQWAKSQAFKILWSPETIERYTKGDFEYVEEVFDKARRIKDVQYNGLQLFRDIESIFVTNVFEHLTTGFPKLDVDLNEGGPSKGDLTVFMAPTGVGKSIALANVAAANCKQGKNVLFVTLELSTQKSALRTLGAMTELPVFGTDSGKHHDKITTNARNIKSSGGGDIYFFQLPPDEISVDDLNNLIDEIKKRENWVPDVLIVDYLELMVSRRSSDNDNDYTRGKAVATQLRGICMIQKTCGFTATQTNRSGNDDGEALIGVDKIAESYGKTMPMDYLVSINQSKEELESTPPRARLYIAKNRNGRKFVTIPVTINYNNMSMKEVPF